MATAVVLLTHSHRPSLATISTWRSLEEAGAAPTSEEQHLRGVEALAAVSCGVCTSLRHEPPHPAVALQRLLGVTRHRASCCVAAPSEQLLGKAAPPTTHDADEALERDRSVGAGAGAGGAGSGSTVTSGLEVTPTVPATAGG